MSTPTVANTEPPPSRVVTSTPTTLPSEGVDLAAMFSAFSDSLLSKVTVLVRDEVAKNIPSNSTTDTTATLGPDYSEGANTQLLGATAAVNVTSPTLPTPRVDEPTTPSLTTATLRSDQHLQAAVTRRLAEIETATQQQMNNHGNNFAITNIKSGRERTQGSLTKRTHVTWPQEFIHNVSNAKLKYDDLSHAEFSLGLLHMVNSELTQNIKDNKMSFITQLHEDIVDIGFPPVHEYTGIILSKIEENILSWNDYRAIDRLREKLIFRHISNAAITKNNTQKHSNVKPLVVCSTYNLGSCSHQYDHFDLNGVAVKHICSFCHSLGHTRPHSETQCRSKNRFPPTTK